MDGKALAVYINSTIYLRRRDSDGYCVVTVLGQTDEWKEHGGRRQSKFLGTRDEAREERFRSAFGKA